MQKKADNLVNRVLTALKGGDKGKLERFSSQVDKHITAQKAIRAKQLEDVAERISDVEDQLKDASESVNVEKLKELEGAQAEAKSYVTRLNALIEKIEDLKAEQTSIQEQIDRLDKIDAVAFSK